MWTGIGLPLFLSTLLFALDVAPAAAAPKAEPWPFWAANDPGSRTSIDHAPWDRFLKKYVVTNHPSGVNRVRYASVTPDDRKSLDAYVQKLQQVEVTRLNRSEQKAYWINLYNALTVKVVLDHYPVKSIRDIKISPGVFSSGPWGAKLATIQGQKVSFDDIEHRVLRPLWKDNRVHYAVNCASIGCPNLQPEAYTPANTEALLERGSREYVNHPRGARIAGDRLQLSSIYEWFRADFGGSEESVVRHLQSYAEPVFAEKLKSFKGKLSYEYDWRINGP
ncbi:MAG: DUF547 domain-containing protein [Deltaproteobacteria bacterium]|nr:DUF547 domain-containing protein [Deltaproteobacteria bacterium]